MASDCSGVKECALTMIELAELSKVYGHGADATVVLDRINFRVDPGEIFAVVGPSGAGKSTLAQCVNLLTPPTSGSVVVNGENLTELSSGALRVARRRIGTVFQSAGLLERRPQRQARSDGRSQRAARAMPIDRKARMLERDAA